MKTVGDKIKDDYYTNKAKEVPYPSQSEIKKEFMKEMETFVGTKKQIEQKEKEIEVQVTAELRRLQQIYGTHVHSVEQELKTDLEREYDLATHPKRDKLWSLAWEKGHSDGYQQVYGEYCELVDLLTP
jgi:hypothetical protein